MSCFSYDKFGRSEFNGRVNPKEKLQDTKIVKVNSSLHEHLMQMEAILEQIEETNG